ncbi:MAG: hypothetical protein PHP45_03505 [Elusimicrobiales bacterium]|nr:hypothetical protein [Elusimicrobiales bacterium]
MKFVERRDEVVFHVFNYFCLLVGLMIVWESSHTWTAICGAMIAAAHWVMPTSQYINVVAIKKDVGDVGNVDAFRCMDTNPPGIDVGPKPHLVKQKPTEVEKVRAEERANVCLAIKNAREVYSGISTETPTHILDYVEAVLSKLATQ